MAMRTGGRLNYNSSGNPRREMRAIKRDMFQAGNIAKKTMPLDPLSRVDNTRSTETQDLINRRRGFIDPNNAAYAGRRSGQMQSILSKLQGGLGGYTGTEMQGMREQQARETDNAFNTGRSQLMRGQSMARTGSTQRSAQLMDLAKSFGNSRAQLEQDLLVKNADEMQRRQMDFTGVLRGAENDEATKVQQALGSYETTLGADRADRFERDKINLGQEAKDRAAQVGAQTGIMGLLEARRNAARQAQLAREQMASNERSARASSGGGGGGGGSYYDDIMGLINEAYGEE